MRPRLQVAERRPQPARSDGDSTVLRRARRPAGAGSAAGADRDTAAQAPDRQLPVEEVEPDEVARRPPAARWPARSRRPRPRRWSTSPASEATRTAPAEHPGQPSRHRLSTSRSSRRSSRPISAADDGPGGVAEVVDVRHDQPEDAVGRQDRHQPDPRPCSGTRVGFRQPTTVTRPISPRTTVEPAAAVHRHRRGPGDPRPQQVRPEVRQHPDHRVEPRKSHDPYQDSSDPPELDEGDQVQGQVDQVEMDERRRQGPPPLSAVDGRRASRRRSAWLRSEPMKPPQRNVRSAERPLVVPGHQPRRRRTQAAARTTVTGQSAEAADRPRLLALADGHHEPPPSGQPPDGRQPGLGLVVVEDRRQPVGARSPSSSGTQLLQPACSGVTAIRRGGVGPVRPDAEHPERPAVR